MVINIPLSIIRHRRVGCRGRVHWILVTTMKEAFTFCTLVTASEWCPTLSANSLSGLGGSHDGTGRAVKGNQLSIHRRSKAWHWRGTGVAKATEGQFVDGPKRGTGVAKAWRCMAKAWLCVAMRGKSVAMRSDGMATAWRWRCMATAWRRRCELLSRDQL